MKYVDTDSPLRLARMTPEEVALKDVTSRLRAGEGVQLECDGRVVGAVISPRDLELYLKLLREYEDRLDIEAAEQAKAEGDWVPWGQVKKNLEL